MLSYFVERIKEEMIGYDNCKLVLSEHKHTHYNRVTDVGVLSFPKHNCRRWWMFTGNSCKCHSLHGIIIPSVEVLHRLTAPESEMLPEFL